jgi:hypothetical protein
MVLLLPFCYFREKYFIAMDSSFEQKSAFVFGIGGAGLPKQNNDAHCPSVLLLDVSKRRGR